MWIEKISISPDEWKYRIASSFFYSAYLSLDKLKDGFEIKGKNPNLYENIPQVTLLDSSGANIPLPLKLGALPEVTYSNQLEWKVIFHSDWKQFTIKYKIIPRFPEAVNALEKLIINDVFWNKIKFKFTLLDSGLLIFLPDGSWLVFSNDTLKKVISEEMRIDSWIYTLIFDRKTISIRVNPIAVFNKNQFTIYLDDKRIVDNKSNWKTYFQNNVIPIEYFEYTANKIILHIPWGKNILFDKNWNLLDGQKFSINFIEAGFMRFFSKYGLPFLSEIDIGTYEIKVDFQVKTIYLKKTLS
jgi:hypothetical protein